MSISSDPQQLDLPRRSRARGGMLGKGQVSRPGPRAWQRLVYPVVIAAGFGLWWLLTAVHAFPDVALPSPAEVWQAFTSVSTDGYLGKTLADDVAMSLYRVAVGFAGAVVAGVVAGLAMTQSRVLFRIIDPFLQFFRPIPPLAYIPLFVVWFGIGELPKILLILVCTLPIIIINTIAGVQGVPRQRIEVAESLGATRGQIFLRVILPSVLPDVFTGMKVAIGIAWTCLVAAELIAADVGLGWLVEQAGTQLRVAIVIAGIIVIGVIGYAMELLIRLAERAVVPWKGNV